MGASTGIACLVFSALEKQRTVLPPWGRKCGFSAAGSINVLLFVLLQPDKKEKNKANQHFMWKPDLRGVSVLLGKAILQQKGWSASVWGSPRAPSALSAADQGTRTGGEPRAGALLRLNNRDLCEHKLLNCTVLCYKVQCLAPRIWECHHRDSGPRASQSSPPQPHGMGCLLPSKTATACQCRGQKALTE